MKKTLSIILMAVLSFSLVACDSKEEKKSDFEKAQTEISEAITPLAQSPEPAKPEKEVFTCKEEMYGYTLSDGVFQFDDIIIDTNVSRTLQEMLALFEEKGDRYEFFMRLDQKFDPFDYNGLIDANGTFKVGIRRKCEKKNMLVIAAKNPNESNAKVSDCIYMDIVIADEALENVWYGGGVCGTGEGYNYDNIFTTLLKDFREGYGHDNEYKEWLDYGDYFEYYAYTTCPTKFSFKGKDYTVYYNYIIQISRKNSECISIRMDRNFEK